MGENQTLRRKIIDTESRIEVLGSRLNELRKECELTHIKNKEIKLKKRMNTDKINRIEIITEKGRELVKTDCKINTEVQDEGRTLKIFVKEILKGKEGRE